MGFAERVAHWGCDCPFQLAASEVLAEEECVRNCFQRIRIRIHTYDWGAMVLSNVPKSFWTGSR